MPVRIKCWNRPPTSVDDQRVDGVYLVLYNPGTGKIVFTTEIADALELGTTMEAAEYVWRPSKLKSALHNRFICYFEIFNKEQSDDRQGREGGAR